jgi:O-antigen/teichoic acid export membrane protein
MSVSGIIARNAGFLITGDVLNKMVVLLFSSVVARELGAVAFGIFSLSQVLGGVITPFVDLGVSNIINRDAAAERSAAPHLVSTGLVLLLALLPFGLVGLLILAFAFQYPPDVVLVIMVVGPAVLVLQVRQLYFSVFKAISRASFVMVGVTFQSLLLLGIVASTVMAHLNLIQVAVAYLCLAVLSISNAAMLYGFAGMGYRLPSLESVLNVLKRAVPLGLQGIMIIVYQYSSTLMLSVLQSMSMVGYYQAASSLVTSLNIIGIALVASVFPFFVRFRTDDKAQLSEAYYRAMKYLLFLGFGIAIGTTLLADKIISLIYGPHFSESVLLLQILIWSEALIFLSFVASSVLLAQDLRWVLFQQTIFAAVLNLAANLVAVHLLGAVGAALTTLATESFALLFLIWQVHRTGVRLGRRWFWDASRVGIACATMGLALLLVREAPLLLLVCIGACVYGGVLVLVHFFDAVDFRFTRQVFHLSPR